MVAALGIEVVVTISLETMTFVVLVAAISSVSASGDNVTVTAVVLVVLFCDVPIGLSPDTLAGSAHPAVMTKQQAPTSFRKPINFTYVIVAAVPSVSRSFALQFLSSSKSQKQLLQ